MISILYLNCHGIGNHSSKRVLSDLCCSHRPSLVYISEPMVAFYLISARFWSSLGLHLVGKDMGGLIPSIWVFSCDSISDPQILLCHEQHLTVSISIESLMHWFTFVYASTALCALAFSSGDGWFFFFLLLFGMPFSPLFRGVSPLTRGVLFSSRSCLFLSVIILGFYGELVFMRWFGAWYSRNQWIFEGKFVDFRVALSLVWRSVYNANRLGIDCMRNCVDDLLILRRFSLSGRLGRALVIRSVVWSPPASGWIKVNTDGTSLGLPSVGGYRGIFRTCRSFVKACFAVPLGQVSAFEAELLAASLAVNYAWNLGWHRI
ncbi:hypothetical protein Dsin_032166 [Dipteronia sinensis]|uniref:RNase H type-1 domain-containing protein n=1 Tax=Dipteronia sinensis TaxID=43782 RepID=A0AAE0DU23_9ROSI|nr:hypothetical protein Dsin_032166 [Dipteronia sinensis]